MGPHLPPAYDLLNTTIVLSQPEEELALPLNARKNKLRRQDFLEYFGRKRLKIPDWIIEKMVTDFVKVRSKWEDLVRINFLPDEMKGKYLKMLDERFARIFG